MEQPQDHHAAILAALALAEGGELPNAVVPTESLRAMIDVLQQSVDFTKAVVAHTHCMTAKVTCDRLKVVSRTRESLVAEMTPIAAGHVIGAVVKKGYAVQNLEPKGASLEFTLAAYVLSPELGAQVDRLKGINVQTPKAG